MKLIDAVIQPQRLPDVKEALLERGVVKITVSNALGCGEEEPYEETYRGIHREVDLTKKVRLEIAVNEDYVQPTVDAIIEGARSGEVGDGKIFITDLKECIRIRTGERGTNAIG